MPLLKQCSHTGCSKVVQPQERYCKYHNDRYMQEQKDRYKDYQHRRMRDSNKAKAQKFYNSTQWLQIKEAVKAGLLHMDIVEYYSTCKITQGETVHHIYEVLDSWENRLDINNLIYLTERNHKRIHSKYNKSTKDKATMQNILKGLLENFYKEFNL